MALDTGRRGDAARYGERTSEPLAAGRQRPRTLRLLDRNEGRMAEASMPAGDVYSALVGAEMDARIALTEYQDACADGTSASFELAMRHVQKAHARLSAARVIFDAEQVQMSAAAALGLGAAVEPTASEDADAGSPRAGEQLN
jgi:hypothetical protein